MRKRPRTRQNWWWLVAAVLVLVLLWRLVPAVPRSWLAGSTGVLSVYVDNPDVPGENPPPPSPPPPHSGGGGGGGGGSSPEVITPQKPTGLCAAKPDVNVDGKVNLADFSILAYWFKRPLTPAAKAQVDLNCDGKVDLVDFSIMAYYWKK